MNNVRWTWSQIQFLGDERDARDVLALVAVTPFPVRLPSQQ